MQFGDYQSIYLQIAGFIEDKILRKEWLPDERIPSVRDLAVAVEVNPNTVMRAYEHLQQQKIIYNQRGIGYFVAQDALNLILIIRRAQFLEKDLLDFFKNMTLLDFSMEEITVLYQSHLQKTIK